MLRQSVLVCFLCFCISSAFAQEAPTKKDSTKIYKDIENYSKRSKFTQFVYKIFFKPVSTTSPPKRKGYKKLIQKPYSAFEGKVIRNINIETLDPFGNSIGDTLVATQNFVVRAGNKMHIKSHKSTIRNLLLIRQNQVFDSLLVKESERLVRSQTYVNDVSFYVTAASKGSDSVDIFIRELDKWSIIPNIYYSESRFTFELLEKNFLGSGHEFTNAYTWNVRGRDGFNTNYFVPNIRNTYVNATLHYGKDEYRIFTKSLAVDRPFFSPFAKWAGGVNFTQQNRNDTVPPKDSLIVLKRFKFNSQDYWAGSAIQMVKGNTENQRATNFISTFRFYRLRFSERPPDAIDTLHVFANQNFYVTSIGISTRKYVQDKFIFNYGITENVPIGRVYSITAGYQERNNAGRVYLGARAALGNYYTWGYLSANLEYGTFLRKSKAEQGVLSAGIIYFTGLLEIGKWKFRQFVKPQITIGLDRYAYDSLTVNEGVGIDGFRSNSVSGTHRVLFTLQSQSYAPWNFIGFRFGPYLTYTLGMLGNAETGFKKQRVYSQFGFGVLIKNLNLVFSTFQISLAYYPSIPGSGDNIFKFNPYKTTDFILRDFEIGKPATVVFQ
jgi:hypothetical protein